MFVRSYTNGEFFDSLAEILAVPAFSPAGSAPPSPDFPQEAFPVRILMVGDVLGRPGRKILKTVVPRLRAAGKIGFITVNGENLAGGFGITQKIFYEVVDMGVDAITMGNHWADKPEVHALRSDKRLVLPQNVHAVDESGRLPEFDVPGTGKTITVLNLMGLFAMKDTYRSPFEVCERARPQLAAKVASGQHIVIADVHAEASSEKQAIAWYLNGVVAGLIGTHTHTPTSDERVTSKGTAFLTDVGFTGPYDSVIGMDTDRSLRRFFPPVEKRPQELAAGNLWFCGFLVDVDPRTGLAVAAHRLQFRESLDCWTVSTVRRAVM